MGGWLQSRGRVLGVAVAILAVLDVGRSFYARVGYREPLERWEPDPAVYANLTWPPGMKVIRGASLGERVFAKRCAVCHGPDGRGNGPAAPSMVPRPRDFTLGEFKYKSTSLGSPPTEGDLVRVVKDGLPGGGMPYFGDLLKPDELQAVVGYVRALAGIWEPVWQSILIPPRGSPDATSVARGKRLYAEQGCARCHGDDYRGGLKYEDSKGYPVIARDLTAPWTFRGGSDPQQLWLRLSTGIVPGPMPSYEATLTAQERWDLVDFVESIARTPPWEPGGKLDGPGQQADPVRRGDYLVHFEMCQLCHTQINETGIYREDEFYLAGGMHVGDYPHGEVISRNLTPDEETGIGRLTVEQIATILRDGRRPDRTLNPWGMPWFVLHPLHPEDATAIASYLKTMPPVRHQVPYPLTYGVAETFVAKLASPLPAAVPRALHYSDGDFAKTGIGKDSRELPQSLLKGAQWVVLLLGIAAFIFAGPKEKRFPNGRRAWIKTAAAVFGLLALVLFVWAIVGLPANIPPEPLSKGTLAGVPEPDLSKLGTPERAALVKRGQYLFTVTSCVLCHGSDGRGGAKLSWKAFGTLWVPNITSDKETGIGIWSDREIARAIRSGVSRDGRQLHWQGMIWDLLSNLDEEDLRSIVAYVRTLPGVKSAVSKPRPPAADDCGTYTFFLRGQLTQPGCR